MSGLLTSTAMAGHAPLPLPTASNGTPLAACARPSCAAIKRRMVELAQQVAALEQERDALRDALDAAHADWGPLGGQATADALSHTERRLVEVLLEAGQEHAPDCPAEGRCCCSYGAVRHATLLRRVWGDGYSEDAHLLRVNIARVRFKLAPHDWDIHCRVAHGYRLVPYDPDAVRRRAPMEAAELATIRALGAQGLSARAVAVQVGRDPTTVRRLLNAVETR